MAQWENRALIDLRVAGSNLAGQLLIYFHNFFSVLTKTPYRHSSLVPRSSIKARAQIAALLTPAFGPPDDMLFPFRQQIFFFLISRLTSLLLCKSGGQAKHLIHDFVTRCIILTSKTISVGFITFYII